MSSSHTFPAICYPLALGLGFFWSFAPLHRKHDSTHPCSGESLFERIRVSLSACFYPFYAGKEEEEKEGEEQEEKEEEERAERMNETSVVWRPFGMCG